MGVRSGTLHIQSTHSHPPCLTTVSGLLLRLVDSHWQQLFCLERFSWMFPLSLFIQIAQLVGMDWDPLRMALCAHIAGRIPVLCCVETSSGSMLFLARKPRSIRLQTASKELTG